MNKYVCRSCNVFCLVFLPLVIFSQKSKNSLPKFPFVNSNIEQFKDVPRDSNGIPMLAYNDKTFHYPIQYTQIALHYYANYLETGNEIVKRDFLRQAKFIQDAITHYKDFSVWECSEEITGYELPIPWASAMSQGYGIGIMLEAYNLTGEEKYLETAKKAINAYNYQISEKGIKSYWDGYDFYEEYADEKSKVLNGFIYSLAGLYYFHKVLNTKESKDLFDKGIETLKIKINEYDAEFTSYYSKLQKGGYQYASAKNEDPDHYHELVIYQLLTLYVWTQEGIFMEYAHKFLKYDTGEVTDYYNEDKFSEITASYAIDPLNYGTGHLNDELWSWGKYWSTNKFPTDLRILFPKEEKNISQIVFYSTSENTLPQNFAIYTCKTNGDCELILDSEEVKNSYLKTYKTGKYETFIQGYYIEGKPKGSEVVIKFLSGNNDMVALREINVIFDRRDILMDLLKLVEIREKLN
ncbi:D-glucuronyl C5-epimerase C-terminus [Muriicola jejuensis]|uniref:D-glucuronyl C5-epimerase C-terminal domain-containing protein n=1 Tax=Muriicola jejuensis TaxID=504488 RepID=A0A6P0UDV9_9FLAO|nr:D-glucuronyl C5-epimerase family protein [Muriicola jejuensis]NER09908.1 hypothetical protein [Muriicola jejuensis]SMP04860.1 D-glucuronyl C5-epimerase C-terminus [Muriicola jejuensis]